MTNCDDTAQINVLTLHFREYCNCRAGSMSLHPSELITALVVKSSSPNSHKSIGKVSQIYRPAICGKSTVYLIPFEFY